MVPNLSCHVIAFPISVTNRLLYQNEEEGAFKSSNIERVPVGIILNLAHFIASHLLHNIAALIREHLVGDLRVTLTICPVNVRLHRWLSVAMVCPGWASSCGFQGYLEALCNISGIDQSLASKVWVLKSNTWDIRYNFRRDWIIVCIPSRYEAGFDAISSYITIVFIVFVVFCLIAI